MSGHNRCEGRYGAAFKLRVDDGPRSRGGRQAEKELHLRDSSQRKMHDLEHRLLQAGPEFARHDELLVKLAAEPLDPAREIDVTADDREIESIARADIAIGYRAVKQRQARGEMGCAVGPGLIPIRERVDPLLCRLKSLPAGCAGPSFHAFIEDRQDAIAHDLHDL